ncbi:acetyl/propionyl/methylcrotonyl-CoA carboxylase subunit alpha [Streptomyces telluris]|uniref:ATP-grasp domain-containing protein n=1 Tax=Streptomyces telluris TaxID=2720021 RepID=A0A9X2RMB4_9ACTN|nr:biotin carboxylase N-terminal domain-containing protein [Streptomyces telluris]MCQ8769186.1 ATP-grasp domain-containing protein [Streptomyces telluris]NJP75803.1 ATP-grasp domain-containing protein [Streptomyces telluris]
MIGSLLVANRGEIACRVFRTCRELGIRTVAVYSDADAGALHVREADAGVRLPGVAAADTYLRGDAVVRAALAAGADAVHPGYGFLSESAEFARDVERAGLVWIGPPPGAIEAMASKTRAKRIMAEAGVPVPAASAGEAPLIIKAAAGGGGRGMRVVRDPALLESELASARAEAMAAFGDDEVFVEPYVEGGRHVEVQVLADAHGCVRVLGTRDCSLQRRHQKVIEEAPAPGLPEQLRGVLGEAAAAAARAVGYVGAGTVEFLVKDGQAFFLEMNTRLQVEHPVTEAVYGLDLVALQIRVAEGAALDAEPPEPSGHAVEARLYAEDPGAGWRPQTGVVRELSVRVGAGTGTGVGAGAFRGRVRGLRGGGPGPYIYGPVPGDAAELPAASGPQIHVSAPDPHPCAPTPSRRIPPTAGDPDGLGVGTSQSAIPQRVGGWAESRAAGAGWLRVDAGVTAGDTVTPYYDPLLAKVIAWAPTRPEAVRLLAHALERARIHGPVTNRELLVRSLRHEEFAAGGMDTSFYERHLAELTARRGEGAEVAALAAAVADAQGRSRFGGWRNLPSRPQEKRYRSEPDGTVHTVRYRLTRHGLEAEGANGIRLVEADRGHVVLEVNGLRTPYAVSAYGDRVHVDAPSGAHAFTPLPRFPDPGAVPAAPGSLLAPMPGTVVRLADGVDEGCAVERGQPLLWLEAMKMEHRIVAPSTGTLTALHAAPGRQVEVGALLAVVIEDPKEPLS